MPRDTTLNRKTIFDRGIWLAAAGQLVRDEGLSCDEAFQRVRTDPQYRCYVGVRTLHRYLDRWVKDGRIWRALAHAKTQAIVESLRPIWALAEKRIAETRGKGTHVRGRVPGDRHQQRKEKT